MFRNKRFDQPTSALQGTIFISFSKLYFIISGYAIYLALTRLLTPAEFGIYSLAISVISVINAILINSTMQTVSKFTSEEEKFAEAVKNTSLKIELIIGSVIFAAFYLFSPLIALLLNDPNLTFDLKIASPMIIFYSLYSVFDGYFNGLKKFKTQALLGTLFSTVKLFLIITMVFLGFSVKGAIAGFTVSVAFIMITSLIVSPPKPSEFTYDYKKIIIFQSWLIVFTLITNLLMSIDLFMLKSLSPKELSNSFSGYYAAALTIARVPFQAIAAVPMVIFPLISKASFAKEQLKIKNYITITFKYSIIFLTGCAVLISTNAHGLIKLLYTEKYSPAAAPLSILAFGALLFSLLFISLSVISGSGDAKNSVRIAFFTITSAVILNYILIPRFGMIAAASATGSALAMGTIACFVYIKRKFGVIITFASFARILLSATFTYALSIIVKTDSFLLILKLGVYSSIYFILLLLLKEISFKELRLLFQRSKLS